MNISVAELKNLSRSLLQAAGANADSASKMADCLVWCNQIGLPNQGVWRLPILCKNLENGGIAKQSAFTIESLTPSCNTLVGQGGFGHIYAQEAMALACSTAKQQGIAATAVRGSNFCGALTYYVYQAAEQNCVAFFFANSFPKVAPYGGELPVLGTNPFAFAAPGLQNNHLILDMSTSSSAGSTVTKAAETGTKMPDGTVIGDDKKSSKPVLTPFGGAKGFGLSLMVEIMAGLLTSAAVSKQLGSLYEDPSEQGQNGHMAIAINIESFMPIAQYEQQFSALQNFVTEENSDNIRFPGSGKHSLLQQSAETGIELDDSTRHSLKQLTEQYKIDLELV
jgi:ureidoglycolate dehydrogenase (NAD+)